jgi:hypothetical protein
MPALILGFLFSLGPADSSQAQITVRGRLAHDLEAVPGQTVSGQVIVDNETDGPQQARVYLRDYLFFADGTNAYDPPGTMARSNAPWVQFSPENLTIPAGASATVSYSIAIPDSATAGSWWSMLMVESVDPNSAESTVGEESEQESELGFRQVTRYGVQLAAHVREGALRDVAFDRIQLVADDDGHTWFHADVINTGTIMLHPEVYMRVFAADGSEYGPMEGVQYRLYPGTSVQQRIDLSDLEPGTYQALLIVDDGDDAVFGGQYELTL